MAGNTLDLTHNALRVLERRYLRKDEKGETFETPEEMFERVAGYIADVDVRLDPSADPEERKSVYLDMISSLRFLPNSPTLMNAGTSEGQLSACFVIPVGDSIKEIFGAVALMAEIHQSGGGTGFSFSKLRPKSDLVGTTGGVAAGPVAFMEIFDKATDVVKQGGRRRGANMGVLGVDHPDVLEFIRAKRGPRKRLANFNLSVALTDGFMHALERGEDYPLVNPRTGCETGRLPADEVFDELARGAWECGDPGVLFMDRINALNPVPCAGVMEATNPCGEQPLQPYESCNLGSINLSRFVVGGSVDWDGLRGCVREAVRFLDNVIEANRYPDIRITEATLANRKVGLGVMGFAEMLIEMGIPYASERALDTAGEVMAFITAHAREASEELGRLRGDFPNFRGSVHESRGHKHMRNATVTTVAPAGTIGIIAGTSGGIEPLFAVAYRRLVMEGEELREVNRLFVDRAKLGGYYSDGLIEKAANTGSIRWMKEVPEADRRLFETALDISPEWHIRMQAAFQKHSDNAVSKTVNLPEEADVNEVKEVYRLAYELDCKGVTVFRHGSKGEQPILLGHLGGPSGEGETPVEVTPEFAGECRQCNV